MPIATVAAQITAVLTDVARFLTRGGRITLTYFLTPLVDVLTKVTAVAAHVAAILPELASVAAHLMTIPGRVGRLLGAGGSGYGYRQRQQCGDDNAVSHDLSLVRWGSG